MSNRQSFKISSSFKAWLSFLMITALSRAPVAVPSLTKVVRRSPAQAAIFNVTQFGAVGDGHTLNTWAITRAIEAAHAAGGGTVFFPAGVYVSGTIQILSHVTLEISPKAVLRASENIQDYAKLSDFGFTNVNQHNISGEGLSAGLIVAKYSDNVAIKGFGTIEGQGDHFFDFNQTAAFKDYDENKIRNPGAFWKEISLSSHGPAVIKTTGRPGTLINFWHCRNVEVRDVTLRGSPNWTIHLQEAQGARISRVKIINDLRLPNNDGINVIKCDHVQISGCHITTGDDGLAFTASGALSVTDTNVVSNSSALRLESVHDGVFENLSLHGNRGIGIYERGTGETYGLLFSNLVLSTRLVSGQWWGKSEPIFIASTNVPGSGGVHDVHFSNMIAHSQGGILLYGKYEGAIRNIFLEQIKFEIHAPPKPLAQGVGGNLDLRWLATQTSETLFSHDIPALYSHNVDHLKIRDFKLAWGPSLPKYFSSALEVENFKDVDIEGFRGRSAYVSEDELTPIGHHKTSDAAVVLTHGEGVSMRNSAVDAGTGPLLSTNDVKNAKVSSAHH